MNQLEKINLFHDELEAIRLCDKEGLTQAEAGAQMGVSRGTVQRMLASARQKIARALVEGAALIFVEDGSKTCILPAMDPNKAV